MEKGEGNEEKTHGGGIGLGWQRGEGGRVVLEKGERGMKEDIKKLKKQGGGGGGGGGKGERE